MLRRVLLCSSLAACTPADAPQRGWDAAARGAGVDTVAGAVAARGLSPEALLREAAVLGSEGGWDVLVTPAFPAPGEDFMIALVARSPRPAPVGAVLRGTTNGFQDSVDVDGQAMAAPGGEPFFLWGPIAFPRPVEAQMAFLVQEPQADVWVNNGGLDYAVSVASPRPVSFAGRAALEVSGLPVTDTLFSGHDARITVDTYPQGPGVEVDVLWRVDGVDQQMRPARIDAIDVGAFGNDTRWEATLPTAGLAQGAEVSWVVRARSVGAPRLVDDGGQAFVARMAPAPPVGWWQTGVYGFSSCHWDGTSCTTGWAWSTPLADPLQVTPSAYQAYAQAPYPAVEVYVAGVTDAPGYDPAGGLLQVEVHSPFFSGAPSGAWGSLPMPFRERAGNNLRFDWLPRIFQAPTSPANGVDCPEEGAYPYRFRLSTDAGRTWTELGDAAFPDAGGPRTLVWEHQLRGPEATAVPSTGPAFADTPVGQSTMASVELVNTHSLALSVLDLEADGDFQVVSCGGPCEVTLDPGARLSVDVRLAPSVPGVRQGRLTYLSRGATTCTSTETWEVPLSGVGL